MFFKNFNFYLPDWNVTSDEILNLPLISLTGEIMGNSQFVFCPGWIKSVWENLEVKKRPYLLTSKFSQSDFSPSHLSVAAYICYSKIFYCGCQMAPLKYSILNNFQNISIKADCFTKAFVLNFHSWYSFSFAFNFLLRFNGTNQLFWFMDRGW